MANRYWVGGSGDWSDDDNHWASASGGSPANGNLPTSSDDVFIDSNSGFGSGGTITLDIAGNCSNFTANSGHTYTIQSGAHSEYISFYGSIVLESGVTYSPSVDLRASDTSKTITTDGVIIGGDIYVGDEGDNNGTWTLQDDLDVTGEFYQAMGIFDANDHNVTANYFYFYADTGYTPTVIMGSGTWEATGTDENVWIIDQYNNQVVTITPETSTIKLTDNQDYGKGFFFYDDTDNQFGKTYNNIWLTGAGLGYFNIHGSNTFNDFKIAPNVEVHFVEGTTTTINTFTATGSAGNLIILDSDGTEQFNIISAVSTECIVCDYLDISNSSVSGGAGWFTGSNSANTSNNAGWLFRDPGDLYWVAGTGDWSDATNHWATSTGGSPDENNLPTMLDNVFIDSSSGFGAGGTITCDTDVYFNDFTSNSGHTYTITDSNIRVYGSLNLESGLTITNAEIILLATGSETLEINSATLEIQLSILGTTGDWTLQDDLMITQQFYMENGTFDANDNDVTASDFYFLSDTGFTPAIVMGSGTWDVVDADGWTVDNSNGVSLSVTCETSTIKFSGGRWFSGDWYGDQYMYGKTYYNLWITGADRTIEITGSNTFNDITIDNTILTVYFQDYSTTTVTTFNVSGTAGNLIYLDSNNGDGQFNLSKTTGTVNCDYLHIARSNAAGGATWNAGSHSEKDTGASGWVFTILDRFWVGGTGDWTDATNHWATVSNGSPGAANLPTSTCNAIFDENSGVGTVTIDDSTSTCNNLDFSDSTVLTLAGYDDVIVYGSLTLKSGMTVTNTGTITFRATEAGKTITLAGSSFYRVSFEGMGGGEWTLQDDLILTDSFYMDNGTFDANDQDVSATGFQFYSSLYQATTVYMGSGTWEVIEAGGTFSIDQYDDVYMDLHAETSTLKIFSSNGSSSGISYYEDNDIELGKTFYNVWFYGNAGSWFFIDGSHTFNEFKCLSPGTYLRFYVNDVTTVDSFNVSGDGTGRIRLELSNSQYHGQFHLSKPSGIVNCDYLEIYESNATGGATWNPGAHSIRRPNVSGWNFVLEDRYWIGGTGNWNDTAHWSTASGGSGGASLPTSVNSVHFDEHSFTAPGQISTVTGYYDVYDMDWTGATNNPTLKASNGAIYVYGSLTFIADMHVWTYAEGTGYINVSFYTTNELGKTITMAGQELCNMIFDNASGDDSWTLQDDVMVGSEFGFYMFGAILDTDGHAIETTEDGYIAFEPATSSTIYLRDSLLTLSAVYNGNSMGGTLDAGTSTIVIYNGNGSFNGGGFTYYNVDLNATINNGAGTGIDFHDSNTFYSLTFSNLDEVNFVNGPTQTILNNFYALGEDGNELIMESGTFTSVAQQNYGSSNSNFGTNALQKNAQSFQISTSTTRPIYRIQVALKKVSTPTDNVVLSIYDDNSDAPGNLVATADSVKAGSTLSTSSFTNVNFNFAAGVELTNATRYWIHVSRSGALDDAKYYVLKYNTSNYYSDGRLVAYNGAAWNAVNYDAYFVAYGMLPWTLSKTSGTCVGRYVALSHSTATGGATWNAENSIDTAYNTGWNFLIAYYVDAAKTAFTITGINTVFNKTLTMATSAISYALTGVNTIFSCGKTLVTAVTAFTETTINTAITSARHIDTMRTDFLITAKDTMLIIAKTMVVSAISFTYTTVNGIFSVGRRLLTGKTDFTLTARDVIITKAMTLVAAVKTFTLSGVNILIGVGRTMTTSPVNFSVSVISAIISFAKHIVTVFGRIMGFKPKIKLKGQHIVMRTKGDKIILK